MNPVFELSSRVAVLTGALGKLGPVWASALLGAGARVAAVDLPAAPIPEGIMRLQAEYPDRLRVFRADVCHRESLEHTLQECKRTLGDPRILVNNAGIDQPPAVTRTWLIEDVPADVCRAIFEVNVVGLFQCAQVFGREMVAARSGSIINIGSLYAGVSPDERFYDHIDSDPPFIKPPAYGASKAAVINLTKYLSTHWGKYGVRVNALSPGGILGGQDETFVRKFSNRVPLGRMGTTSDLCGPLLFLASDASAYVTGINLEVDGGYRAW